MKRYFNYVLHTLPYLFVFIASLYLPRDPDLGWHLKYGEYFFKHHQILRDNIFSSTMTNYHWANGSWGTDILTYAIYIFGGFLGLTLISALIVTVTFFFFAKAAKFSLNEKLIFFPLFAFFETGVNSNSFRGQQISLLFLGILLYLLSNLKDKPKLLWAIPVLFFAWSNMQIESFLGIAVLGLWTILTIFIKHKELSYNEKKTFILLFLSTIGATFINPFGWNIHLVALSHIGDPLLLKVDEYIPFQMFTMYWWNQIVGVSIFCLATCILLIKKQFREYFPIWTITLILFVLTFSVRRYSWPAFYLLIVFIPPLWRAIEKYLKKFSSILSIDVAAIMLAFIVFSKMPFTQYIDMNWDKTCTLRGSPCSPKSADFLIKHNLTTNVFTYYDWGGWLIWNYPQLKPSIDGRMHLWKSDSGNSIFEEYDQYMHGKKDISKSSYKVIYIPKIRSLELYTLLSDQSKKGKWKLVYDDEISEVIVRQKE